MDPVRTCQCDAPSCCCIRVTAWFACCCAATAQCLLRFVLRVITGNCRCSNARKEVGLVESFRSAGASMAASKGTGKQDGLQHACDCLWVGRQ